MPNNLTLATLGAIEESAVKAVDSNKKWDAHKYLCACHAPALVKALRGALEALEDANAFSEKYGDMAGGARVRILYQIFRNDNPGLLPETVSGEEDHAG